jgi:hypothetical protein
MAVCLHLNYCFTCGIISALNGVCGNYVTNGGHDQVYIVYCNMFRPRKGYHQAEILVILKRIHNTFCHERDISFTNLVYMLQYSTVKN